MLIYDGERKELPNEEGKFIQMYLDKKPLILFSEHRHVLCRDMLRQFLEENSVPFSEIPSSDMGFKMPVSKGERYGSVGMGLALVVGSETNRKVVLTGRSFDYGGSVDRKHLDHFKDLSYSVSDFS